MHCLTTHDASCLEFATQKLSDERFGSRAHVGSKQMVDKRSKGYLVSIGIGALVSWPPPRRTVSVIVFSLISWFVASWEICLENKAFWIVATMCEKACFSSVGAMVIAFWTENFLLVGTLRFRRLDSTRKTTSSKTVSLFCCLL